MCLEIIETVDEDVFERATRVIERCKIELNIPFKEQPEEITVNVKLLTDFIVDALVGQREEDLKGNTW